VNDLVLILYAVFSAALFWSCLCRLRHTCKRNTQRAVRWVFTALTVMALVCLCAPLLWHYEPDRMATALLGLLAMTQIVTSHFWRQGVPPQFRKDDEHHDQQPQPR
jgi:hypothetical protein